MTAVKETQPKQQKQAKTPKQKATWSEDIRGISLAIVKRSVEKMGGMAGVDSTPGVGSTFWFELPEAAQKEPTPKLELAGHEQV